MSFHTLVFGYYPYFAFALFVVASTLRLRRDMKSWRSGQAELCHIAPLSPLSKLFHLSMVMLLFGHVAGMLVPFGAYKAMGLTASAKQLIAAATGGASGLVSLAGLAFYLHRRLTDPEKRATGTRMDVFVLLFLLFELLLGLGTIPLSLSHADGTLMVTLSQWAYQLMTMQAGAADLIVNIPWLFKLHLFLGISFFVLIPLSHLVHMWTLPLRYFLHRDQVIIERKPGK